MNDIYDMKLFESHKVDACHEILRVPGGWVMGTILDGNGKFGFASCFVPYHPEFSPKKQPKKTPANRFVKPTAEEAG